MAAHDFISRSFVKTITYRLVMIMTNFVTIWLLTGNMQQTFDLWSVITVTGTIIYFIHERVWSHIMWGKRVVKR